MAGFYLIVSGDPAVRSDRTQRARTRISPVPCEFHLIDHGDIGLLTTALSHTPFSTHESPDGELTVLLGAAISENGHLSAEKIAQLSAEETSQLSGLFVRFTLARKGTLSVQGGPFAIFPVFYRRSGSVVEIASSPNAIRCQPGFSTSPDPVGIARYLLGHGSSGARTLETSIRHLESQCRLLVSPERDMRLTRLPLLLPSGDPPPHDAREACEEANFMISTAILRHDPGDISRSPPDLLFSGGLDSRLLLAHFVSLGIHPRCLTRGIGSDHEVNLARIAAKKSHCPWLFDPDPPSLAPAAVEAQVRIPSLFAGMSSTSFPLRPADGIPPAATTYNGFFFDSLLNPFHGLKHPREAVTFESEFQRKINLLGIPKDVLEHLFLPVHRDAVREAVEEMRAEWEALPADPPVRCRHMSHHFRTNHHIGGLLWKSAFTSWPVTVGLDVPLLRRLMGYPPEWFIQRFLERRMLAALSPTLAKIPLDANHRDPKPIIPTFRHSAARRFRKLRERWFPQRDLPETRRYHRVLDMNGKAWAEVRSQTDALRHRFAEFFDTAALDAYFPPSGKPIPLIKDAISEHGGRRMLAGLALHLDLRP